MKQFKCSKADVYACVNYSNYGNDFEKYELIKKDVFEKFKNGREEGLIIKNYDLLNWIRIATIEHKPVKKCLSNSFFEKFKKDYRIIRRKVTRFFQSTNFVKEQDYIKGKIYN